MCGFVSADESETKQQRGLRELTQPLLTSVIDINSQVAYPGRLFVLVEVDEFGTSS